MAATYNMGQSQRLTQGESSEQNQLQRGYHNTATNYSLGQISPVFYVRNSGELGYADRTLKGCVAQQNARKSLLITGQSCRL